jgi:hypothetical protein
METSPALYIRALTFVAVLFARTRFTEVPTALRCFCARALIHRTLFGRSTTQQYKCPIASSFRQTTSFVCSRSSTLLYKVCAGAQVCVERPLTAYRIEDYSVVLHSWVTCASRPMSSMRTLC